jgi:hypothetical protein
MTSIDHTSHAGRAAGAIPDAAVRQNPGDQKPGLVPAKFSDMYRGAIAAAVDANGDGEVSGEELADQLRHAGGSGGNAGARLKALDTDGDGKVSQDEFAKSIADPLENDRDALLRQIINELSDGKSAKQPQGYVLDASGKVADPHAVLRYLAATFPGNVNE